MAQITDIILDMTLDIQQINKQKYQIKFKVIKWNEILTRTQSKIKKSDVCLYAKKS